MSQFNRRGFMKTLLVTAVGAVPAHATIASEAAWPFLESGLSPSPSDLEHDPQQLRLSPTGLPFAFQNFLRINNEWKAATLPNNPFITGDSFPLISSQVKREDSRVQFTGEGKAEGQGGKSVAYTWDSEISAVKPAADFPWFRFRTTLHLPAPVRLHQDARVEPQIITWLSSSSTLMEGQSGSWRRVLLEQPTRNSLGTYGNDLPALYLLDQTAGVETMMFFDFTDMNWMSIDNIPRFLSYRCSSVSRIERDGTQRLGVGLLAQQATGNVLPAGDINFTYWLLQRPMTRLLTAQESVSRWMQALLPLFEEKLAWPGCATSWKEFAAGTVEDLQDKASAQIEAKGHTGLRAYVKSTSQLWTDAPDNFELMTIADVLWPSLLYLRLHPSAAFETECNSLLADLPAFYHPETHSISNDFSPKKDERADSWYPFENSLIKYPMIGNLAGSNDIKEKFLDAFQTARKMAHQYNYLFPIYYQVATLQAEGAGTNYAVGGLYAWAAILANKLTGEAQHLEEARRAIQVLYTVPPDRLFHEPQELAFGALAAAELGMVEEARYLLYEQLRMFYWYSDPSQKKHDIRGMVQAAASILYPAFKENVEAILPWTGVMKRGIVFEGLLRFMDQQRRNNFYFFENCTANRKRGSSAFIPFENLGTLELAGMTGNVGKEIYGAGECLWMYLMFEALGRTSDRELMLVNLDLLDVTDAKQFPPRKLNFILYNPTPASRSAKITVPAADGRAVRLTAGGKPVSETLEIQKQSFIRLQTEF
ncbi:MAG TPA: hypothetical protein VFI38_06550 [Candidatus Acidoferrum sp.]|nr:hypothetical protein [Candidatus Acidoferrum sp.]